MDGRNGVLLRDTDTLQHVAMLEPEELEMFMIDLIEHPMTARATVADWFEKAWSN